LVPSPRRSASPKASSPRRPSGSITHPPPNLFDPFLAPIASAESIHRSPTRIVSLDSE